MDLFSKKIIAMLYLVLLLNFAALAQTTGFTFQGRLLTDSNPASGNHDFEFSLFDSLAGGAQIGSTVAVGDVPVVDGTFSVRLDFGGQFPGADRFLEIRVRQSGAGAFTVLSPRQKIGSAPYSIKSLTAETAVSADTANTAATATNADNALNAANAVNAVNAENAVNAQQLGGIVAKQYVLTTDARLSDARNPLPNSPDYIRNSINQQMASNFNISGTGRADIFDAAAYFSIAGQRIVRSPGSSNLFVGASSGDQITGGNFNAFFGSFAGFKTTTGGSNSFFGALAGSENTTGVFNSFFGQAAGRNNTTALYNSYFGKSAGEANQTGQQNSMFGYRAGNMNIAGSNSYFGFEAGELNAAGTGNSVFGASAFRNALTGSGNAIFGVAAGNNSAGMDQNSFFGGRAGLFNTSGSSNSFFGYDTGAANRTGGNNTLLGANSNVGAGNLTFATALGAGAVVSASNTIALGRTNGADSVLVPGNLTVSGTFTGNLPTGSGSYIQNTTTTQTSSNFNISGTGKAGIFDASTQFNIGGARVFTIGTSSTVAGVGAGTANLSGSNNSFFGTNAGSATTASDNSFFGYNAGRNNTGFLTGQIGNPGGFNSFFGSFSGENNTTGYGNTFAGAFSGIATIDGDRNSFFGYDAGMSNTTGGSNVFLGSSAGNDNTTGNENTFIGTYAGFFNQTGTGNTALGGSSGVSSANLTNASAIGWRSYVTQSNSLVLGSISGINNATANTRVGIGTTAPTNAFTVVGTGAPTGGAGGANEIVARFRQTSGANHLGVSIDALAGTDPILYLAENGSAVWDIRNDAGNDTFQIRFQLGGLNATRFSISSTGATAVNGTFSVATLGSAGSSSLCRNASNQIANCSSSLRYKSNVSAFSPGLDIVRRLRPVSFDWRDGGRRDLGLIAEEVAEIEPLLTTRNGEGRTEGVKYDRVGVVLVNAVREQQTEIEAQRKQLREQSDVIRRQESEIKALELRVSELEQLKQLVCAQNKDAAPCRADQ